MSDFITVAELRIEAERLCDENDQLKVENDELKNDADLLRAMLSQVQTEKRRYMAENDKLRDLLQRTWDAFHDATAREFVAVKNELRELGIKVDG